MTTTQGPMQKAVAAALREAKPQKQDGAAVQLVKRYAGLMDDAERLAATAADTWADLDSEDDVGRRRLAKLEAMVQAHVVASDLGPKLLAALTALGMTAAGRGAKGGVPSGNPVAAAVDEFTKRRTRRQQGAG